MGARGRGRGRGRRRRRRSRGGGRPGRGSPERRRRARPCGGGRCRRGAHATSPRSFLAFRSTSAGFRPYPALRLTLTMAAESPRLPGEAGGAATRRTKSASGGTRARFGASRSSQRHGGERRARRDGARALLRAPNAFDSGAFVGQRPLSEPRRAEVRRPPPKRRRGHQHVRIHFDLHGDGRRSAAYARRPSRRRPGKRGHRRG